MIYQTITILFLYGVISIALMDVTAGSALSSSVTAAVTVQATNNTQVPSTNYVVNAIQCLEEAYSIYDDQNAVAQVYADLFAEKHGESVWNVAVGYTTLYVHSSVYVEAVVTTPPKGDGKKGDVATTVLYEIFSSD